MDRNSLSPSLEILPVVQEIRTVLNTARGNVAKQVNNELLMTYWHTGKSVRLSFAMSRTTISALPMVNRPLNSSQKSWRRSLAKVFPVQIFIICVCSIWPMRNSRQCLENWAGRIIASFSVFPILIAAVSMKRKLSTRDGLSVNWNVRSTARCLNGCFSPKEISTRRQFSH